MGDKEKLPKKKIKLRAYEKKKSCLGKQIVGSVRGFSVQGNAEAGKKGLKLRVVHWWSRKEENVLQNAVTR